MSTPKTILVVDNEATCWETLPPNKFPETRNEIIEIGLTVIEIKTKKIVENRSILVRPRTTKVSEFCTKLTTLTEEQLYRDGIDFHKAIEILDKEYRAERNIFASWGFYDYRSFEKNCSWANVRNPLSNLNVNVKALYAAKYGHTGALDKIASELNIPFTGTHHRGVDDSLMVAKILLTLL